jgi:hypothetical protein
VIEGSSIRTLCNQFGQRALQRPHDPEAIRTIRDAARECEHTRRWEDAANLYQYGIELDSLNEELYRRRRPSITAGLSSFLWARETNGVTGTEDADAYESQYGEDPSDLRIYQNAGTTGSARPKAALRLRKPASRKPPFISAACYQATARIYGPSGSLTGNERRNTVPWGAFVAAERRPPCASTIERLIDKPMPGPSTLVV